MGTPKRKCPASIESTVSRTPIAKYGASFPRISSGPRTGVEMSCSMVPVSHSLAMVSDVSSAAMSMMMTAMSPGTM